MKSSRTWLIILVVLILGLIFMPIIINNLLINSSMKTAEGLGNPDWLNFWAAYVGGALGVITTFIAFTFTYKQNEKQNKDIQEQNKDIQEQNKIIQEQNIAAQDLAKEQMRLQALPFITVYREPTIDYPNNKQINFDFNGNTVNSEVLPVRLFAFRNIGVGPAINVSIRSENLGHFSVGEYKGIFMGLPLSDQVNIIYTEIIFYDRENRKYKQEITFVSKNKIYEVSKLKSPERIPSYETL